MNQIDRLTNQADVLKATVIVMPNGTRVSIALPESIREELRQANQSAKKAVDTNAGISRRTG